RRRRWSWCDRQCRSWKPLVRVMASSEVHPAPPGDHALDPRVKSASGHGTASRHRPYETLRSVPKYQLELGGWGFVELVVGALGRGLVLAPADQPRCVAEAAALQVLVTDLDHPLGSEGDPGEVLGGVPAAGGAGHA